MGATPNFAQLPATATATAAKQRPMHQLSFDLIFLQVTNGTFLFPLASTVFLPLLWLSSVPVINTRPSWERES